MKQNRNSASSAREDSGDIPVTVNPYANHAPSFVYGLDQTVNEDSGPQTVTGWAANISPGPAKEIAQQVTFLVSTDNDALFASLPAIDPQSGTLTYTPAPHAYGQAEVTVRLRDDGGTAHGGQDTSAEQTFTITINSLPVVVTDVLVHGSRWAGSLPPVSILQGPHAGKPLPWLNADTILVTFSRGVVVPFEALAMIGRNLATYVPDAPHFVHTPGEVTASWQFATPFAADTMLLNLASGATQSQAIRGTRSPDDLLNGGSVTEVVVRILPGDATQNGVVNVTDLVNISARVAKPQFYLPTFDITANGVINVTDLVNVSGRIVSILPAPPVSPAPPLSPLSPQSLAPSASPAPLVPVVSPVSPLSVAATIVTTVARASDATLQPTESTGDVQLVPATALPLGAVAPDDTRLARSEISTQVDAGLAVLPGRPFRHQRGATDEVAFDAGSRHDDEELLAILADEAPRRASQLLDAADHRQQADNVFSEWHEPHFAPMNRRRGRSTPRK